VRLFWRREAKSAVRLTEISDLRAAQWSGAGQLAQLLSRPNIEQHGADLAAVSRTHARRLRRVPPQALVPQDAPFRRSSR
jgi:hypothetical protein